MQILVQVYCTNGPSLRQKIADDRRLEDFSLRIGKEQQPGRSPGWLKVRSLERGRHGAVNIEWYGRGYVLTCRVATRGRGKPSFIIGDFLAYLMARHRTRIRHIAIVP